MIEWLKELDDLLRGRKSDADLIAKGTEHIPLKKFVFLGVVLGLIYGLFMGLYSVLNCERGGFEQMIASGVKTPALFLLTLIVTFPSLYVFSALLGARLDPLSALKFLVAAITVNLAILASFAPITGFFTLTTPDYHFIKILNVFFFAVAGVMGLKFLMKLLNTMEAVHSAEAAAASRENGQEAPAVGAVDDAVELPSFSRARYSRTAMRTDDPDDATARGARIFRVWLVLYMLVGAQMGWVLRPFIGAPHLEFTWFREREANVFIDILRTIGSFF